MKLLCLLLVSSLFFVQKSYGKIWRVNNNPGVTADFTTAQAAHDAATAGDTLHIEPSATAYGSLTITKQLTIISLGNFLGSNPGLQYSLVTGTLGAVSVSAAGTVLMISASSIFINSGIPNITMLRCHLTSGITLNNSDNSIVLNSFFSALSIQGGSTGVIVKNNIIGSSISMDNTSGAEITNNIITATSVANNSTFANSTLKNNIFNKAGGLSTITNSSFFNNIASGNYLPAGNGNQNNVTMTNVFVNPNGLIDKDFLLQTAGANPAQGTGEAGVDCGAFGGNSAFKLGLIPPVPSIYRLDVPTLPSGNTLNVIMSTRSNN